MKYTIFNVFLSNVCREFQDMIKISKRAFSYVIVAKERKTYEQRNAKDNISISGYFTAFHRIFVVYYLKFILIWTCCKYPNYSSFIYIYIMSMLCRIFSHREILNLHKLDILYWNNIKRNLQNQDMTYETLKVIQVYCQIQLRVIIKWIN